MQVQGGLTAGDYELIKLFSQKKTLTLDRYVFTTKLPSPNFFLCVLHDAVVYCCAYNN